MKKLEIRRPVYRVVLEAENGFSVPAGGHSRQYIEKVARRVAAENPTARVFVETASRRSAY